MKIVYNFSSLFHSPTIGAHLTIRRSFFLSFYFRNVLFRQRIQPFYSVGYGRIGVGSAVCLRTRFICDFFFFV